MRRLTKRSPRYSNSSAWNYNPYSNYSIYSPYSIYPPYSIYNNNP